MFKQFFELNKIATNIYASFKKLKKLSIFVISDLTNHPQSGTY